MNDSEAEKCLDLAKSALLRGNSEGVGSLILTFPTRDANSDLKIHPPSSLIFLSSRTFRQSVGQERQSACSLTATRKVSKQLSTYLGRCREKAAELLEITKLLVSCKMFCNMSLMLLKLPKYGMFLLPLSAPTVHQRRVRTAPGANDNNGDNNTSSAPEFSPEQEAKCKEILRSKDYYDILGVGRDCSAEEVKKAYRKVREKFSARLLSNLLV